MIKSQFAFEKLYLVNYIKNAETCTIPCLNSSIVLNVLCWSWCDNLRNILTQKLRMNILFCGTSLDEHRGVRVKARTAITWAYSTIKTSKTFSVRSRDGYTCGTPGWKVLLDRPPMIYASPENADWLSDRPTGPDPIVTLAYSATG